MGENSSFTAGTSNMQTYEEIREQLSMQYGNDYFTVNTSNGIRQATEEERNVQLDAIARTLFDKQTQQHKKIWPTVAAFWREFSNEEKIAIITSENPHIKLLNEELRMWRGEVWSTDERVVDGLNMLVQFGILTAERAEQIVAF